MSALQPFDEGCLRSAIKQSQIAVENGSMPFGATIADERGHILFEAPNRSIVSKKRGGEGDCTCHAEMEVIRMACREHGGDISQRLLWTVYASTEPCVMCAGAIYWSGIGRLVYGCSSEELTEISGPGGFDVPVHHLYGLGREGMRKIEVLGPLLSDEALEVHRKSGIWNKGAPKTTEDAARADIEAERLLFLSGVGAASAIKDDLLDVPIIDISTGSNEEIASKLWDAASTVGFFTIVGHGIPQELIDDVFQASSQFFALPRDDKESTSPFAARLNSGYEFMSQVRPSTGTEG
jgi:tRNA(adenine34) deaminase